jgi:small subunit ribosomal protein S17
MQEQQTTDSHRKERVGVVVSDKMDKTVVVAVDSFRRHRIYKKVLRRTARYKAHDEKNDASVGDLVRIRESRPLSRLKRWRVVEIVQRHEVAETKPSEIDSTVIEELERRRKEAADEQSTTIEPAPAAEVDQPVEVPEVEEVSAEASEAEVETDEVPVEKAESSEDAAEGPAAEAPKASRSRRRSAADPAEGSADSVSDEATGSESDSPAEEEKTE